MFKSGFVSIIGRPNVGKSTLLNTILGNHISITSPISQTTRNMIKGIYTSDDAQIVFLDTPGIHKPKNSLGEYMNRQSLASLDDADLVVWIVDVNEDFGKGDLYIASLLKDIDKKIILVFNKTDVSNDLNKLNENEKCFKEALSYASVLEISALKNTGIDKLLDIIKDNLPIGPMYYDKDTITDVIERFVIKEIIREKIFLLTKDEVPHSIAVDVDDMKVSNNSAHILSTIFVDRESLKKIIIGAKGQMIKQIGYDARCDIEKLLSKKVYLELWVKVEKDWRNKKNSLSRLGYK